MVSLPNYIKGQSRYVVYRYMYAINRITDELYNQRHGKCKSRYDYL